MRKLTGIAATAILGITMTAASATVFAGELPQVHELDFDEAVEAALQDAGLTEDAVTFSRKMNDYENGIKVYEIDFLIPGEAKFDYKVDALTGDIIEKEKELWETEDDIDYKALLDETANYFDFNSDEAVALIASSMTNMLEEAASIDSEHTLCYKEGMEFDDGMIFYEVGLLLPNEAKYEYKYDARTQDLFNMETEPWEAEDDIEYADLLNAESEQAPAGADDAAEAGQPTEETAKAAAFKDAGFSESEVTRVRCEKDFDDGIEKYDVQFIGPDGMEYEYEISAVDGSILGREADYDD